MWTGVTADTMRKIHAEFFISRQKRGVFGVIKRDCDDDPRSSP